MGIGDWWSTALGTFKTDSQYVDVSELAGKRFAVDLSILLCKNSNTDIDKLAQTSTPPYPAPDLLQKIQMLHNSLSDHIELIYVYDGIAPPHKNHTKEKRRADRDKAREAWTKLVEQSIGNPDYHVDTETLATATTARMKANHPTAIDHANILQWMKKNDIQCIGAIAEADQQMVKLERDGIVDGIISEDGDVIALGAKLVLCKMSRKNNLQYQFKVFDREKFMHPSNPYSSKLCKYPHLMTDASLLLGNDYCPRLNGNGKVVVIEGSKVTAPKGLSVEEKKQFDAITPRNNDSILDKLASVDDKESWLHQFGVRGSEPMPSDSAAVYWSASAYMLHAPVLQYDADSGEVAIVPLNAFAEDANINLATYLDMPELNELANNKDLLASIYHCNIVPLERKAINSYNKQLPPTPIFGDLDFNAIPIAVQPTLCLINWLRARCMDIRPSDERSVIEACVQNCLRVDKPIRTPALQPIVGEYDGYKGIRSRQANNQYDLPNRDYFSIASNLQFISDDSIDLYLGETRMSRPSIRTRVDRLFSGGHYDPKTITCRNVETKADDCPCILIVCKCLSSKTSVMHTVNAVFEDKTNGKYRVDVSSCSCKKGEHFCSHSIGFLYIMSTIQQKQRSETPHTQEEFERHYRVNPLCVQATLMLIENAVLADTYQQQLAQRNRKRKSQEMNE